MQSYLESLMIIILEMLCCRFFFETFAVQGETEGFLKRHGFFTGLVTSVFLISGFLREYMALKVVLIILVITIWMDFSLKLGFCKSIILATIFEGLLMVTDSFTYLLCISFLGERLHVDLNDNMLGMLLVILGKMILFLFILLLRRKMGGEARTSLHDTEWLRFIFFPIYTICAILIMLFVLGDAQRQRKEIFFFVLAFGLVGMNIAMFNLLNDILKCEVKMREAQLYALEARNQIDMYRTISEGFTEQRRKTHEYKNQILCIESLVKKGEYSELTKYVGGLGRHLDQELDYISTNHVIVDAILNAKYHEMVSKDILFVFHINDLSGIIIEDEDLVIILSNLLNNAIAACEKCIEKKIVKMKFIREETSVVIAVKNSCVPDLNQAEKSKKRTDMDVHGYGIPNIKEAVNKYNGVYSIRLKEREFYFSIIIPCKA